MPETATRKIPKLDFLRALSALAVVLYHRGVSYAPAGFGVLTFFVISGFLITHLLILERERTGGISLKGFYLRRSLRIFPAFYVFWLLAVADMVYRHRLIWQQAACSFFYVNNYYQGLHGYPYSLLSHTWSLGVEEQFYILWPGVFCLFRNSLPRVRNALMVVIPTIWVYRAFLHFGGVNEAYIYTALDTRIDAILAGCLLAIVWHTNASSRVLETIRRPKYLSITLPLLALSLILEGHFGVPYRNVVGFAIDPLLVAALIAQLITMKSGAWMDAAPISYLGRISYSTYLYQQIVLPAAEHIHLPFALSAIVCVVATWAVAALSFEVIEKPFLKLKRTVESVRVINREGRPVTGEA